MNHKIIAALFLAIVFLACNNNAKDESKNHNTPEATNNDGWVPLFDGVSTNGWHIYNKGAVASAWVVEDSQLVCKQGAELLHGDLVTDKEYENYELKFDWKISEGGNSGVFINVVETAENPTAWASGPEYQLLDKTHQDAEVVTKKTGGIFGFAWQGREQHLLPAGEWNHSVIKQQDGKVSFYLNGYLTTEQDFTSPEWTEMVAKTHFKAFPAFGKQTRGRIALQDWAKGIAFKNISIKEL